MKTNRIIWAFNPFDQNLRALTLVARVLKNFERIDQTVIEPVFVLYAAERNEQFESFDFNKFERKIKSILHRVRLNSLLPARIIEETEGGRRAQASQLIRYAKERNAQMIATATHARSGIRRWLLGSFAESLLPHSPAPVLFVNPSCRAQEKIKTVLFPTDFSAFRRKALGRASTFASHLGARLIIYHDLREMPYQGLLLANDASFGGFPVFILPDAKGSQRQLKKLKGISEQSGVRTRAILEKESLPIADAILEQVRKQKADLLYLSSERSGQLASIGGITKELIRHAPCPVYIDRAIQNK